MNRESDSPEKPLEAEDSQGQNLASESLDSQGLQEPEIDIAGKRRELAFEQINEVVWKLTDGRGSIAWNGDRSGGYRTTRAIAWLMGVGNGLWVVRYRNKASRPMKLNGAKRYAVEMMRGVRPGINLSDPIARLNQIAANEVDAAERRKWPIDLMGGTCRGSIGRELRQAILDTDLECDSPELAS